MAESKSAGSTPTEKILAKLCDESFLAFWSYPNTFRQQGGPKEVADLIVVSGNHIILFSDKSCAFPNTGNLNLDWSRWGRKAIGESASQLFGAERRVLNFPENIFLDRACTVPMPLSLSHVRSCTFHRIAVALGAKDRCKAQLGRSGSLTLNPSITGTSHWEPSEDVQPFVVGSVDPKRGFVHVLDDLTLPLLLKELDTISDFIAYLEFKESLLTSGKVGAIQGEENLLALFLSGYCKTGDWHDILALVEEDSLLFIENGGWDLVVDSDEYRHFQDLRKSSNVWDRIIQEFATHAFGGTLIPGSPMTVGGNEPIFRVMAQETRIARAFLGSALMEGWAKSSKDKENYRAVASPTLPDTLYVFVFVPNDFASPEEYRTYRQDLLSSYCYLVGSNHRQIDRVFGIATDAADEPYRTFDVASFDNTDWTSDLESLLPEIAQELGVSGKGPIHRIVFDGFAAPEIVPIPELPPE